MKKTSPILIIFFSVMSCITPLDLKTDIEVNILVVEGYISTLPGPYNIKLTTSAKYGSVFEGVVKPEQDAEIWIKDNEGNTVFLNDAGVGNYTTPPGFRGEVGKTYVLNIRTSLGVEYASLPETIEPVAPIDSLYFRYKKQPTTDPLEFVSGVEVYGVWQDPPSTSNYYLWRNSGVYFIKTFPERYVPPGPQFGPAVPVPKDCCEKCWITEKNADFSILIDNDNNTDGTVKTQLVAFIEDDGARYIDKYKVVIDQLSISKEAFQFFNLLKNQKSIDGDIFDPPPATVRGNIINLSDPESNVIGYFHASDGRQISGFIERSVLEDFQRMKEVNDDCRTLQGATTVEPEDWN